MATLFRKEAVEHQRKRMAARSDLLRISPGSTAWMFRILCAALLVSLFFMVVGKLSEYATGPAVVRIEGRTTLTADWPALVSKVRVAPGDRVKQGDLLVQLYASEEAAEFEAVSQEFNDQLSKLLNSPDDVTAREALVSLRMRRDLARSRLDQRSLRAPHDGVVGDVRVRPGQMLEAGMSVLELVGEQASATVIAMLPGRYRPLIKSGAAIRFEIEGFHRRTQELEISGVADQVVGPAEAARYIGKDLSDAFPVQGPVVLVQAQLPSDYFEAEGTRFQYAHGMHGRAETVVRDEPVAYAFLPGLRQWVERVW
ncbi:MAG: HlyD family efflux transporter periplasmic adaptor subunit [Myxococcales bacterium]